MTTQQQILGIVRHLSTQSQIISEMQVTLAWVSLNAAKTKDSELFFAGQIERLEALREANSEAWKVTIAEYEAAATKLD